MSEGNGYATKDALQAKAKKPRRTATVEIPGWGKIKLHTITAGEYIAIDAAQNRAMMLMAREGVKSRLYIEAARNVFVEIVKAIVAEPVFTDDDRDLLLSLDSSTADEIRNACLNHANLSEANLEAAQKK